MAKMPNKMHVTVDHIEKPTTDDFVVQDAKLFLGANKIPVHYSVEPPLRLEFGRSCKLSFACPNLEKVYEWWATDAPKVITVTLISVENRAMSLQYICDDWQVTGNDVKMELVCEFRHHALMHIEMGKPLA